MRIDKNKLQGKLGLVSGPLFEQREGCTFPLSGREAKLPTRKERLEDEQSDMLAIKDFIPREQKRFLVELWRTRTYEFEYKEPLTRLRRVIEEMPGPYQTEGQGDEAIVWLHYFTSSCDWWVIEKDADDQEDGEHEAQSQCYGFVRLNGDSQNAESGYISIAELRDLRLTREPAGVQLDFHWTPKTLREVKLSLGITPTFPDKGHCKSDTDAFYTCKGVEECECACVACLAADKAAGIEREGDEGGGE